MSSRQNKTSNLSISFIIPPSIQVPTPGREFFMKGPFEGITSLATFLNRAGYEVNIVDCRSSADPVKTALENINDADIVGLATYADSFTFLESFMEKLGNLKSRVKVILGGPLVTSTPELRMKHLKADIAVLGEAEITMLELLKALKDGSAINKVSGLCFKDEQGQVIFTGNRGQIRDLDELPSSDYLLWPEIKKKPIIKQLLFSTSRGCYKNCSFCYRTIRELSAKSPERFKKELVDLKEKHGVEYVFLNDLTISYSKERASQICDAFKYTGIKWSCTLRIDELTRELMEKIKSSNCVSICPGIESVDQEILNACHKDITVEQILQTVRTASDIGIEVRGLLIIGLPGETEASLEKLLKFVKEENIIPLVKYLTPFPGTELYKLAKEKQIITDDIDYLRWMSERKVAAIDDKIINLTGLSENSLRNAFRQCWEITTQRTGCLPEGL